MDWRGAVKPVAGGGIVLAVEVVPGSKDARFPAGFNAWRGRLEARVRAPPEQGKANAELAALVAEALGVATARVRVTSGQTSRRKGVTVDGLDVAAVTARLERRLDNREGPA